MYKEVEKFLKHSIVSKDKSEIYLLQTFSKHTHQVKHTSDTFPCFLINNRTLNHGLLQFYHRVAD